MKIPKYAQDLIIDAVLYLQSKGFNVELPIVNWRHRRGYLSSGHAHGKTEITITAGKNRTDQKLVTLHELAHLVTDSESQYWNIERAKKRGWVFNNEPTEPIVIKKLCHTDKFWDTAWDLYRHFKLPIRYCLNREKDYRKASITAYHRSRNIK